jgi:cobalamin biosynthetic protein CobC
MASMSPVGAYRHGGRLREAAAAFPRAPTPWLDLSTGINPEPWRGARAEWSDLARLPDPAEIGNLENIAADAFGVEDSRSVCATAGAEAGLRLLPAVIGAADIAIVSPTYSGHEAAWRLAGRSVTALSQQAAFEAAASVLVIVNPNNPDGRRIERSALLDLVTSRSRDGLWTIVDESFVEASPELSVSGATIERLVVLRSFGKFYGLPGVRLGFVIAEPVAIKRLRALLGDWPVSADAVVIGRAAYLDESWCVQTRERLERDAHALDRSLATHGLTTVGGTSLFRLISTPLAGSLFTGLCERGILTRPFQGAEDHLRIGVPREADLARLAAALERLRT